PAGPPGAARPAGGAGTAHGSGRGGAGLGRRAGATTEIALRPGTAGGRLPLRRRRRLLRTAGDQHRRPARPGAVGPADDPGPARGLRRGALPRPAVAVGRAGDPAAGLAARAPRPTSRAPDGTSPGGPLGAPVLPRRRRLRDLGGRVGG